MSIRHTLDSTAVSVREAEIDGSTILIAALVLIGIPVASWLGLYWLL